MPSRRRRHPTPAGGTAFFFCRLCLRGLVGCLYRGSPARLGLRLLSGLWAPAFGSPFAARNGPGDRVVFLLWGLVLPLALAGGGTIWGRLAGTGFWAGPAGFSEDPDGGGAGKHRFLGVGGFGVPASAGCGFFPCVGFGDDHIRWTGWTGPGPVRFGSSKSRGAKGGLAGPLASVVFGFCRDLILGGEGFSLGSLTIWFVKKGNRRRRVS